jgi:hypothetical protein
MLYTNTSAMKAMLCLVATLALTTACSDDDEASEDTVNPREGYITGKVVDTQGNPIAGAEVVIDNTMFYNNNIIVQTNAGGIYEAALPTVGTYAVSASIQRTLNDKTYTLDLASDMTDVLSNEGGVVNFEWRLTGKKQEDMTGYFGASVSVNGAIGSEIYDPENIIFTLEPVGELIDGSEGKTLTMRTGEPYSAEYGSLVDIPLGRYIMTASYERDGKMISLKIRNMFDASSVYSTRFQLNFEPETVAGDNMAIIEYLE